MKVLHYLSAIRLADGGVCRAVLDFCAMLAARGHEVVLQSPIPDDAPEAWRRQTRGLPLVERVEPASLLDALFARQAPAPVESRLEWADLCHLHTPWDVANLTIARAARRHAKPYILSVHGMLDDWSMGIRPTKKKIFLALAARSMLERASFVHCTAESERQQAQRWCPRAGMRVLPLACDLKPYAEGPGPEAAREAFPLAARSEPKALFLSRFHTGKRVEILIEAVARLRQEGRDIVALLAGAGDDEYDARLKTLTRRLGLEDHVAFLGMVKGDLKTSLYRAADVFVLPTIHENFGLVIPEAMAAGTPVVTTRGVSIWEELADSGGALIADADPDSVADTIWTIVGSSGEAERMGRCAREWALNRLDESAVLGEYERLYEEAIGSTEAPAETAVAAGRS